MNNFLGWLMGEPTVKDLTWLFETPPDRSSTSGKTSDEITIKHMIQSLESMRAKVAELQADVDLTRRATNEIETQYNSKLQHYADVLKIARQYKRDCNIIEARLAMATAIQLERTLPEIKARLERFQDILIDSHEIHAQKESDLYLLEIDLKTIEIQTTTNGYQDSDKSRDLMILHEKFRNVRADIEHRYQENQIAKKLANPSNCELRETLTSQDLDDRIRDLEDV